MNLPLIITRGKAAVKIRKAETNGKLDFFTELESGTIHILTIHQDERDQEKCFRLSGNSEANWVWCSVAPSAGDAGKTERERDRTSITDTDAQTHTSIWARRQQKISFVKINAHPEVEMSMFNPHIFKVNWSFQPYGCKKRNYNYIDMHWSVLRSILLPYQVSSFRLEERKHPKHTFQCLFYFICVSL